jgi:integrase/recombinase XerD
VPRLSLPVSYAADDLPLAQLLDLYRGDRGLKEDVRTFSDYEGSFTAFISYVVRGTGEAPRVRDLTVERVNDFVLNGSLRVETFSPRSKRTHASNIRSLVSGCRKLRLVPQDTLAGMELPAVPELDPVCFTDEQVAAIFDHLERDKTSGNLRLRAMANITLDNGARPAEVVGIRLCDVTYKPREVRIMGKAQRERYVPLGEKSLEFIDDYLRVRPRPRSRDELLFLDLRDTSKGVGPAQPAKDLKPVLEAIGILASSMDDPDHTYYTLRKTFARRAAESGMDVAELASIMGHQPGSIPMLIKHYYAPSREHKQRAHAEARPADGLHEWRGNPDRPDQVAPVTLFDRATAEAGSGRRPIGRSLSSRPAA